MPTYVYACEQCGHEFEREQRITEDPIRNCPACGKESAKRMITQGNFILKGSGWYSDLYSGASNQKKRSGEGGSGSNKTGDSSGSSSGSSEGGGSGKSESKPASSSTP